MLGTVLDLDIWLPECSLFVCSGPSHRCKRQCRVSGQRAPVSSLHISACLCLSAVKDTQLIEVSTAFLSMETQVRMIPFVRWRTERANPLVCWTMPCPLSDSEQPLWTPTLGSFMRFRTLLRKRVTPCLRCL